MGSGSPFYFRLYIEIRSNMCLSFIFATSEFERKHGRIPENAIVFMYTGGEEVGLYHSCGILLKHDLIWCITILFLLFRSRRGVIVLMTRLMIYSTGVGTGGGGKGACAPLFRGGGGKDMFVPPPPSDPEFRPRHRAY